MIGRSAFLAIALILPIAKHADCVFIGPPPRPKSLKSSSNLHLTLRQDGQVAKFALVTLMKYPERTPLLSSASDGNGGIDFAQVAQGQYRTDVLTPEGKTGSLLVSVISGQEQLSTSANFLLEGIPDDCCGDLHRPDVTAGVQKLRRFKGILRDRTGAGMQQGTVIIVSRKPVPNAVVELTTSYRGEFKKELPFGEYIVFASHTGFRTKIFNVLIAPDGEEDLDAFLDVTASC